jgi:hypothetical protein
LLVVSLGSIFKIRQSARLTLVADTGRAIRDLGAVTTLLELLAMPVAFRAEATMGRRRTSLNEIKP